MDIKTKAVKGVGWMALSQITQMVLQFVIIAILAHLLTPSDFGLIAMIVVFTNFASLFSNLGLTYAIIQKKDASALLLSSTFWVNLGVGLLLTVAFAAFSPLIAAFYEQSALIPLIAVLSLTFLISSLGGIQSALFAKELNFRILAIINMCSLAAGGLAAIILAFDGFGVWALVWFTLTITIIKTALLCVCSKWRPSLTFSWSEERKIIKYGLNLTGFNFVHYFARNLDNLLIGRFLGSAPLGFYDRAYQLMLFPLTNISAVLGQVAFPSLSIIQHDKKRVREAYIEATRLIAAITFPLATGLLVLARPFILTVFGPQWTTSILLVQVLSVASLIQSVETTVGWIYLSQARTDVMFRIGVLGMVVVAISFFVGLKLGGLLGLTISYTVATYLIAYVDLSIAFRQINLRVSYFFKKLQLIIIATFLFGSATFIIRILLDEVAGANNLFVLAVASTLGVFIYYMLLRALDKQVLLLLTESIRTTLSGVKKPTGENQLDE